MNIVGTGYLVTRKHRPTNEKSIPIEIIVQQCVWALETIMLQYLNERTSEEDFHDNIAFQLNILDVLLNGDTVTQHIKMSTWELMSKIIEFTLIFYQSRPDKTEKLMAYLELVRQKYEKNHYSDLYSIASNMKWEGKWNTKDISLDTN